MFIYHFFHLFNHRYICSYVNHTVCLVFTFFLPPPIFLSLCILTSHAYFPYSVYSSLFPNIQLFINSGYPSILPLSILPSICQATDPTPYIYTCVSAKPFCPFLILPSIHLDDCGLVGRVVFSKSVSCRVDVAPL